MEPIDRATLSRLNAARETGASSLRLKAAAMRISILFCAALTLLSAADTPQELMEKGHFKRVRAIVDQNYRANPKDPETLWLMARLKQTWHELPAALDFAEKALAANPKEARYHYQVGDIVGEMASEASLFHQVSLGRRFKKEMDAALALDPDNVEVLKDLLGYYFLAPGIVGGDKAEGHALADQIMKLDPVAGYDAQIDVAHFEKQKNVPYEEIYRKMIAARPTAYTPHIQLSNLLLNRKNYEESLAQAREAIRMDPGRAPGHTLIAVALAFQGKWADLDAAVVEAEKDIPDDFSRNIAPAWSA